MRDYENASRKENWYIKKLIHERSLNMMLDSQREVFPPSDGILIYILYRPNTYIIREMIDSQRGALRKVGYNRPISNMRMFLP